MKTYLLTTIMLLLFFANLVQAQDKRVIKSLIQKYEKGVELSEYQLEQITPYLENAKIIKQNRPHKPDGIKANLLTEDFSGGALPAGWTNVDELGTNIWLFNNPGGRTINTTTNANGFVIIDSDFYSEDGPEKSKLTTRAIDCSGKTTIILEFEHFFERGYGSIAEVLVSGDNGGSWTSLQSWVLPSTANAQAESYDISAIAAGKSQVLIQWYWQGNWSWYWAVDDIVVYEPDGPPVYSISPVSKYFGTVNLGESSSAQTFTISNDAGGTLNVTSATIIGANAGDFTISNAPSFPQALTFEQSFTIDVTFSPGAAGARSANLRVITDAKVDNDAPLTGTGHDPTLTPPFTEEFATVPPTDWTRGEGTLAAPTTITGSNSAWVRRNYRNDAADPNGKSANINIYGTNEADKEWLFSPPINLGDGTIKYQLEFDLALTDFASSNPPNPAAGSDDKFAVIISTDGGTTWSSANSLQTWDNTTSPSFSEIPNTGQHITISLASYTGIVKIGFYGESTIENGDNDLFVDNVQVQEIPLSPISPIGKNFGFVLNGATSATQTFTISNTGAGTLTIPSAPTLTGANPSDFSITDGNAYPQNLTNGQSFQLDVEFTPTTAGFRSANLHVVVTGEPDHDAALSGTGYDPYSTLSENFDGATSPALPEGWSKIESTTNSSAVVQTYTFGAPNSAPNHVYLFNSGDAAALLYLVTPKLTDFSTNRIRFKAKSSSSGNSIVVGTMSDPKNSATFTPFGSTVTLTTNYTEYNIDFTSYAGSDKYIAFKHNLGGTFKSIYIDDFVWEVSPAVVPDCAVIVSPTDGATSVYANASLNWLEDGSGGSTSGYKIYFGTDGGGTVTPTNIENGTDLGNVLSYTPTPALNYFTTYYWQVVAYNATGNAAGCPIWSFTTERNPNYGGGRADEGGYYFANSTAGASGSASQPTYNWIDPISEGHTLIAAMSSGTFDDGYFGPQAIGFTFNFFGTNYTVLYIGSNGLITFGNGYSSNGNTAVIPNGSSPNNMIAALLQDLDDRADGKIYYGTTGGEFVVTWWHYHDYQDDAEYATFQVILNSNGNIKLQYNYAESAFNSAVSSSTFYGDALIGIENSDGTVGVQYRKDGTGAPIFDPSKAGNMAVVFGKDQNALPVELTTFEAAGKLRDVTLNWETKTEINSYQFNIERRNISNDNSEAWVSVGEIQASGNSNSPKQYSYIDKKLNAGTYEYRLMMIDNDGKYEYSPVIESEVEVPKVYALTQNYPNPFNPSTKIDYQIPYDAKVTLELYSILGERIATLLGEEQAAGYYTYQLNGSNLHLASGVYIYRMIAQDKVTSNAFVQVKKMVLLK